MTEHSDKQNKLIQAYNRMMEHVKAALEHSGHETHPAVGQLISKAKEKAVELGELTLDEAEKIGAYLQRDLEDAANYLAESDVKELADWFRFDLKLIEDRMLELFISVADKTSLELLSLQQQANEYHTGEITGIGALYCSACGQAVHFHTTGHIPPCPKCHHSVFKRHSDE